MRDYGTASWEGGEAGCDHKQGRNGAGRADGVVDERGQHNRDGAGALTSGRCDKCGARRIDAQLGLEPTLAAYVANMVAVFEEVRRVLKQTGSLWLNLGDSYAGRGKGMGADGTAYGGKKQRTNTGSMGVPVADYGGLKPKDLCGVPWRVAFALQEAGWWLRSAVVWAKPNAMPSSQRDRPTNSYEMVFLLAKSERYFYDEYAVREPHKRSWDSTNGGSWAHPVSSEEHGKSGYAHAGAYPLPNPAGRTLRDVWTIPTRGFRGAHFATFPEELVQKCIRAGCPEKVCVECGKPWERKVEKSGGTTGKSWHDHADDMNAGMSQTDQTPRVGSAVDADGNGYRVEDLGFFPTCSCDAGTRPGIVLDPFMGAGTVGLVAEEEDRHWVGIELSPSYCQMAQERIEKARRGRTLQLDLEPAP